MRRLALVFAPLCFAACANPEDPDAGPSDVGADAGKVDFGVVDSGYDAGVNDTGPELDATPNDRGSLDAAPVVIVEVAYGANAEEPLIQHLYLTESSTTTHRVTPNLAGAPAGGKKQPTTGGLVGIHWTFDGSRLLYVAHQDTFDVAELYQSEVVASRPRPPTKISAPNLVEYASLRATSPVANAIVFNQGDDYYVDLTASPLAPAQINTGLISEPVFSPNGAHLAYRDIIVSASDRDLWFYDIASATKERVNPGANLGFGGRPIWAPDSSALFYAADELGNRRWQFFSVPVSNGALGARQPLHDLMPADRNPDVSHDGPQLSPDGRWLAISANVLVRTTQELVVFDLTQPFPQTLDVRSGPAVADVTGVVGISFNETSDRLAYRSYQDSVNNIEAFVTDLSFASAPVKVSPPATGGDQVMLLEWARGGELLLMRVQQTGNGTHIYAVDTTTLPPGPTVELSAGIDVGQELQGHSLSPDRSTLIIQAGDYLDNNSIYSVDLGGATPGPLVKIADTPPSSAYCWSPDGSRLAFAANIDSPTKSELYLLDRGQTTPVKISGPMIDGAQVFQCAFPPR